MQNQKRRVPFTITAKNLQGFDGFKGSEDSVLVSCQWDERHHLVPPTRRAGGSYTVTTEASDHENADAKYEAGSSM